MVWKVYNGHAGWRCDKGQTNVIVKHSGAAFFSLRYIQRFGLVLIKIRDMHNTSISLVKSEISCSRSWRPSNVHATMTRVWPHELMARL